MLHSVKRTTGGHERMVAPQRDQKEAFHLCEEIKRFVKHVNNREQEVFKGCCDLWSRTSGRAILSAWPAVWRHASLLKSNGMDSVHLPRSSARFFGGSCAWSRSTGITAVRRYCWHQHWTRVGNPCSALPLKRSPGSYDPQLPGFGNVRPFHSQSGRGTDDVHFRCQAWIAGRAAAGRTRCSRGAGPGGCGGASC